jgi:outer membrane beta-barrel protein
MAIGSNKKTQPGLRMQPHDNHPVPSARKKTIARKLVSGLLVAACGAGVFALSESAAQAQEIQLTGPLAGQPPVRKQRLYREGRFEIAPSWSFTLLDEYRRTMLLGARLQYNITEWFGIGAWGGYGLVSYGTDLSDQINKNGPKSARVNLGKDFDTQTGKLTWMANPQVTFSPFRGKLALFNSLFADTDIYLHAGVAFAGVEERADCEKEKCSSAEAPTGESFGATQKALAGRSKSFTRASRVAIAPSFGLGLSFYPSKIVSFGFEYRAFPFSWNRSGFDTAGGNGTFGAKAGGAFPDLKINSEDRTFKFNQMFTIFVGFSFPKASISD